MNDDHGLPAEGTLVRSGTFRTVLAELPPLRGDIILYTADGRSALSSRLVIAGEILAGIASKNAEQYSHGAVYIDEVWQYEAVWPRCIKSKIDYSRQFEIWRFQDPTPEQRDLMMECAKEIVDRRALYDIVGVCTKGFLRVPGTYYCTRLCGTVQKAGGVGIGDEIYSPDSLTGSYGARMVADFTPPRSGYHA